MDRLEGEALYQQLIMQRTRTPLHAGLLEPADAAADGNNPFCGDRVHVTLRRGGDGRVSHVLHQTRACAICAASADLMAETVTGLDDDAIRSLSGRFDVMLHGGLPEARESDLGLLEAFGSLHEYQSRIRCATLPWAALLEALGIERTI